MSSSTQRKWTQIENPRSVKESLFKVGEYQAQVLSTGGHSEGLCHLEGLLHPPSI